MAYAHGAEAPRCGAARTWYEAGDGTDCPKIPGVWRLSIAHNTSSPSCTPSPSDPSPAPEADEVAIDPITGDYDYE